MTRLPRPVPLGITLIVAGALWRTVEMLVHGVRFDAGDLLPGAPVLPLSFAISGTGVALLFAVGVTRALRRRAGRRSVAHG
ncbi:hypothetical protein CCR85_08900 [Rhodothalassium salexigens]|uniref:hypothetical protein n=1 Tax=Rhodothalassium salexigens TaxID=1086 RepID=UPI0019133F11|nr:hypothetical protein [Rhodothalassium salexigens]MBK5911605.1 hypothetical protein [Rhodothalassium salexigens]MBK5920898.1 hypothetical protein [Rhodothalassium salexigens]